MVNLTVTVVRESLKRLIIKHGGADNADVSKQFWDLFYFAPSVFYAPSYKSYFVI